MSVWVLVALILLVVLAVAAWQVYERQRSRRLQDTFGPEYQRTPETSGDRRRAESELEARRDRRQKLDIRPLDPAARESYSEEWRRVQGHFVDAPEAAAREADVLVIQVMTDRGYPMADFEQRAADISVDHPRLVEDYRTAHAISGSATQGSNDTEQLRRAMQHFRSLFDELLGPSGSEPARSERVANDGSAVEQPPVEHAPVEQPADVPDTRPMGRRELS